MSALNELAREIVRLEEEVKKGNGQIRSLIEYLKKYKLWDDKIGFVDQPQYLVSKPKEKLEKIKK